MDRYVHRYVFLFPPLKTHCKIINKQLVTNYIDKQSDVSWDLLSLDILESFPFQN